MVRDEKVRLKMQKLRAEAESYKDELIKLKWSRFKPRTPEQDKLYKLMSAKYDERQAVFEEYKLKGGE